MPEEIKAKDYETLRRELDYVPQDDVRFLGGYSEPIRYQATLHVTDDQMQILNQLVSNELKRVRRELTKQQSQKQRRKLEDLEHDIVAIQDTMKENVW